MKRLYFLINIFFCQIILAQHPIIPGAINLSDQFPKNGKLDNIEDFALRLQVPFIMPDGTALETDIYLPILQDSLVVKVGLPTTIFGTDTIELTLLPKGFQYIQYKSKNGKPNPIPQQLPGVLERTPYNKNGERLVGSAMSLLGYAGFVQDMRGRYASEGVYLPLYSDSWAKSAYHQYTHILDLTNTDQAVNGNYHEDGYNTIEFIKNNLMRNYDLDNDGTFDTIAPVFNGSLGMFGASALAYNQLQAAAAKKIDPNEGGLKCLFPMVGPGEFYKSTGIQNGVFREQLVSGWLLGQIIDTRDDLIAIDNDLQNDIHTSFDYGTSNKFEAADKAIDHFVVNKYEGHPAGYYPNSIGRKDMDISRAMINENGESDLNGTVNRYTNMEVPVFSVTGWWDIFIDGSIETWANIKKHNNPSLGNKQKQKIIIGPWAHQTIANRTTGDLTYPENILDLVKVDISNLGEDLDIAKMAESELLSWFRANLNYNNYANVGEPTITIPSAKEYQTVVEGLFVKFPARDFKMPFVELINFITGASGLKKVPISIRVFNNVSNFNIDLPSFGPLIEGFEGNPLKEIPKVDFTKVPDVRFYVVGPVDDPANSSVGNYWFSADTFPIKENIHETPMYLHANGKLNFIPPKINEGYNSFIHDPDNPVLTVGGANMILKLPDEERESQGQINLANKKYDSLTMTRNDVLHFTSDTLQDTLSIIGFTKVKLYAESHPENTSTGDPTDTDFFVRILDVYPDGREMYVVGGCINARARAYARSIVEGKENDNAIFSNIESGKMYEYYFQTLPIAYTFGVGHQIKVLISSSNHPRYQSNPNLPIENGDFFRRQPKDGKTYLFQGTTMHPRKAANKISFAPNSPTQIIFPVYENIKVTSTNETPIKNQYKFSLWPNPTKEYIQINSNNEKDYKLKICNILGQTVKIEHFRHFKKINVSNLNKGHYFIEILNKQTNQTIQTLKFRIQ